MLASDIGRRGSHAGPVKNRRRPSTLRAHRTIADSLAIVRVGESAERIELGCDSFREKEWFLLGTARTPSSLTIMFDDEVVGPDDMKTDKSPDSVVFEGSPEKAEAARCSDDEQHWQG